VDLTVTPAAGAPVAQSFSWTEASGGVLRAGLYLPPALGGSATLASRGLAGGSLVAQASDVPLVIVQGERAGPFAITLVLTAAAPSPDAGADAADAAPGTDTESPADAGEDAAADLAADSEPDTAPDLAEDLPVDRAPDRTPDLTPDLGPDAPPAPPSLVACTAYTHIAGTCDLATGAGDWAVGSVRFSPDGRFVVSGGQDGRAKVWKVTSTGLVPDGRVYGGSGTMRVEFSPDGVYLAISSRNGPLTLIEFATNSMAGDFIGHPGLVHALAFTPDSKGLASVDDKGVVKLWDVATRTAVKTVMAGGAGVDIAIAPKSPPGRLWAAVALASGGTVSLLDFAAATVTPIPFVVGGPNSNARTLAFSPDGTSLAVGTSEGEISLWGLTGNQAAKVGPPIYTSQTQLPWDIAFSRDGLQLAMAWAGEGGVVLTSSTQVPRKLGGSFIPEWIPTSVAFSPDGLAIVAGEYRCGQIVYCKD
jgi:WD40 repeat protein